MRPAAGHARPATVSRCWCPLLSPHGYLEDDVRESTPGWSVVIRGGVTEAAAGCPRGKSPHSSMHSAVREEGLAQKTQVSAGADAPQRVVMVK